MRKKLPIKKFYSEVKDLDEKSGYVEAYANVYNVEDSDGDISHPSSLIKTVSENFKKIRVFKNHNSDILVGVPKNFDAHDPYGLKTGTQFNMEQGHPGRNMFFDIKLMMENGQDADLSIGYEVLQRDQKDKRIIKEYKLWEYSFLTSWGANNLSVATGIKSDNPSEVIEMLTKAYNLPYTDSRLIQIENLLKSLAKEPDQTGTTLTVEPTKSIYSLLAN